MNIILFDETSTRNNLKPLSFTRPIAEIRCGILTIKEKWEHYLQATCSYNTEQYLQKKFPQHIDTDNIYINSSILPSSTLVKEIINLPLNKALYNDDTCIAIRTTNEILPNEHTYKSIESTIYFKKINYPWDIFTYNHEEIEHDFELLTKHRSSQKISASNNIIAPENIFIEEGATMEFATLNASKGKIYIGKNSTVMEGAHIRGPFALCESSEVKMLSKIYEGTTIGPHCKVGGEVQNSVFFGYANKSHDGYLGNAVIGEWCNLGADTNNSNLKNDYSEVRVWNYSQERFIKTGLQFCGLIMGDHSKSAINTMFNTGTVVGVSSNVFGSGFPRNFFPSFSWGGSDSMAEYPVKKACDTAQRVYARRKKEFNKDEIDIFTYIFEETKKHRRY